MEMLCKKEIGILMEKLEEANVEREEAIKDCREQEERVLEA